MDVNEAESKEKHPLLKGATKAKRALFYTEERDLGPFKWLLLLCVGSLLLISCDENTCQKTADCRTGNVCLRSQCSPAGTCFEDSDCAFRQTCESGTCRSSGCTQDSDCEAGATCNVGFCVPPKKIGETCDPAKDAKTNLCAPDLICIALGASGICFQDCTSDATVCKGERPLCLPFALSDRGYTLSVCLDLGNKGDTCGYGQSRQITCRQGSYPPLYCSSKSARCEEATIRTELEFCSQAGDPTDPWRICDAKQGLYCNESEGKCRRAAKLVGLGEPCNTNVGEKILCQDGAICVSFSKDTKIQRCALPCEPTTPNSCGNNQSLICAPVYSTGAGLCLTSCQQDSDCPHKGDRCRTIPDSPKVCVPDFEVGPKTFGELCTPDDPTTNCTADFFCLLQPDSATGYCNKTCTSDTNCPALKDENGKDLPGKCMSTREGGEKTCLYPCPEKSCPNGFTCLDYGKDTLPLCLVP